MSEVVVLFCRCSDAENAEIFDGVIEKQGRFPAVIHRSELSGWVAYHFRSLWLPRKDGVFAEIPVYIHGDIEDIEIIGLIVDTLDAPEE